LFQRLALLNEFFVAEFHDSKPKKVGGKKSLGGGAQVRRLAAGLRIGRCVCAGAWPGYVVDAILAR